MNSCSIFYLCFGVGLMWVNRRGMCVLFDIILFILYNNNIYNSA